MFGANNILVSWYALDAPILPGRMAFGGGLVNVGKDHIDAWVTCPNGVWEAEPQVLPTGHVHYRLLRFHPDDLMRRV